MQNRIFSVVLIIFALLCFTIPAAAEKKPQQLELFGVPLKGAQRDQIRQAIKKNSLQPVREDKNYWIDTYDAQGVLEGATEFVAGYVSATDKFAYAEYKFPAFIDTQMVVKVINMVTMKYGRPSSKRGSYGLGEVSAKWNLGQGMQIEVYRGWPDTTTYLKFVDTSAHNQMRAEITAAKNTQERQKTKAQNQAF